MNTFALRGVSAQIKWGYLCAATLGSWTLTDGELVAHVAHEDTFRVSQWPLTFTVGAMVRPVETLQITGGTLTARLGPQEFPHASMSSRSA